MKLKNKERWEDLKNKNAGDFGKAIIDFTENWAELMESEIKKGSKVSDAAEKTRYKVDNPTGISGFMRGIVVRNLAEVWKYGEEFRIWHNLDVQIGNEGEKANKGSGVLNPALLTIGEK